MVLHFKQSASYRRASYMWRALVGGVLFTARALKRRESRDGEGVARKRDENSRLLTLQPAASQFIEVSRFEEGYLVWLNMSIRRSASGKHSLIKLPLQSYSVKNVVAVFTDFLCLFWSAPLVYLPYDHHVIITSWADASWVLPLEESLGVAVVANLVPCKMESETRSRRGQVACTFVLGTRRETGN